MRAIGATVVRENRGWGAIGPLAAARTLPKLVAAIWPLLSYLRSDPPALLVLVDFGAFNLRLAKLLRRLGYARPILYFFPPGAWVDRPRAARAVAAVGVALTPFAHQRDFYRSLGLPIEYFGHPLRSVYAPRRLKADETLRTLALFPGSRENEIRQHAPLLIATLRELRRTHPELRAVMALSDEAFRAPLEASAAGCEAFQLVDAQTAFERADAGCIASGTAVLEAALRDLPACAFYKLPPAQARVARYLYRGRFITIPNLVLQREVVPELLQDAANPAQLAAAVLTVWQARDAQRREFATLREALGPADALEQCARFASALAAA